MNTIPLDQQEIKKILEKVENKAKDLAKKIKTNQIRNFYSKIIQIKQEFQKSGNTWNESIETKIHLLKPTLAYAAGRQNEVKKFKEFLEIIIEELLSSTNKSKALERFFMILESFVAYHKFYGGEDN